MARKARGAEAADAVRGAVDRTFQATVGQAQVRERAQELVDELSTAAGRVRAVLDDLRIVTGEEVRALREDLDRLERRVRALERPAQASARPVRASKRAAGASKPSAGASKVAAGSSKRSAGSAATRARGGRGGGPG